MIEHLLIAGILVILTIILVTMLRSKKRLVVISGGKNKKRNKLKYTLKDKRKKELMDMAVDNDHYQFLLALEEGRITEKQYDEWVHSRKHEGPEMLKLLLRRPYKTRDY